MKRCPTWRIVLFAFTMAPVIAIAQSHEGPLARISGGSSEVSWQPLGGSYGYSLRVTGPEGFIREAQFPAGMSPSLSLFDTSGGSLQDGLYKWELRAVVQVSGSARKLMQQARDAGDDLDREALGLPPAESLVQSGSFRIENGAFIGADLKEGGRPAVSDDPAFRAGSSAAASGSTPILQEVLLTSADGVIRNSLCVGFDCPNSPVFDDSTILMMENNTRIKFGDTSNSPFPNNDWEIEANSSLSGGPSYLGFNDCGSADNDGGCASDLVFAVEAGARASALYVESDGDVGIGTSNPVLDLHIVTGNTPAMRLDQDGSSGFTPQVWDIAGNEANFFVRDVTSGSRLPLRIRPGAPTSSIDISAAGNVGIGTAAPDADTRLHVKTNGNVLPTFESGDGNAVQFRIKSNSTNRRLVALNGSGNVQSQIVLGDSGSFTFLGPTGTDIRATLNSTGLDVVGQISLSGVPYTHPDYVFESGYELPTIDNQAKFMWTNKHLPAVGAGTYDTSGRAVIDIGAKTLGMLEELEKAHIYIEQLHRRILALEERLQQADGKN